MRAAQEKKGLAATIIEVGRECSYADFLVVVSATNERQTAAIAEGIADRLRADHGERPLDREGQGGWVLLDYGDVVVHVFQEDTRQHYDLDRLWANAPRVPVPALPLEPVVEAKAPSSAGARRRSGHR